jgi:biopolymer transport protein ExbD
MSRRKKKRMRGEVELNLAAMLDMAFQLLTFFILTFKPAPVEGDVMLRMPPPMPTTMVKGGEAAGANEKNTNPVQGMNSLIVTVLGNASGNISQMAIGDSPVVGLAALDAKLRTVLGDSGTAFDQVLIQVGSRLHYDSLMQVIDVCTRQTVRIGNKTEKLSKLSFVELPGG